MAYMVVFGYIIMLVCKFHNCLCSLNFILSAYVCCFMGIVVPFGLIYSVASTVSHRTHADPREDVVL